MQTQTTTATATTATLSAPGQALALASPSALDPYTPRDLGEAMTLAKIFAASKILGAYGTTEQVMLVMATGAELGLPPTAALRGLYVVEGRIFMSSDLMVALCLRAGQCERFDLTEQSDAAAAYTVKRRGGQELTFRFTIEEAKRAMLGGDDGKGGMKPTSNWMKYPGMMCRHRAAAIAARAVFPDVIMGLYDEGERDEVAARGGRDVTPAPVQPLPSQAAVAPSNGGSYAARAAAVVDAEVVEDDETRIVRLLGEAKDKAAVGALAAEALKVWPKERPEAVKAAHVAAKARVAAPAGKATPAGTAALVDAAAGQEPAAEREPGADDGE